MQKMCDSDGERCDWFPGAIVGNRILYVMKRKEACLSRRTSFLLEKFAGEMLKLSVEISGEV